MSTMTEKPSFIPSKFISKEWLAILFGLSAFFMFFARIAYKRSGVTGLLFALIFPLFALFVIGLETLLRLADLKKENRLDDQQMQALIGLYVALKPRAPFPEMRRWAGSPDLLLYYSRLIIELKPGTIVELGSGVSSIVSGYSVEMNKKGKVIALDHEQSWGGKTGEALKQHGLEKKVEVRFAPLVTSGLNGGFSQWYDLEVINDVKSIDLLLVDGPPDSYDQENLMPALHLLKDRFNDNTVILFDDTYRPIFRSKIMQWAEENGFHSEWLPFEKGAIVLRRTAEEK